MIGWYFQQYAPDPRIILVAHSVYFQILRARLYRPSTLYFILISTHRLAGGIIKQAVGFHDLAWAKPLANMIKASLLGFAVGGAFSQSGLLMHRFTSSSY